MNRHANGSIMVGSPGSYQRLISGLKDAMKKPHLLKDYDVFLAKETLIKRGKEAGIPIEQMKEDWVSCFDEKVKIEGYIGQNPYIKIEPNEQRLGIAITRAEKAFGGKNE